MLIPFQIAFFVATFVCDLVFWGTHNPSWFDATLWLLGAGLIMAALAAVAGLIDVLGEPKIRALGTAWWHAGGNVVAVIIEIVNFFLRYGEGSRAVLPAGIILSAVVVAILLFTGWKGWELVYRGKPISATPKLKPAVCRTSEMKRRAAGASSSRRHARFNGAISPALRSTAR